MQLMQRQQQQAQQAQQQQQQQEAAVYAARPPSGLPPKQAQSPGAATSPNSASKRRLSLKSEQPIHTNIEHERTSSIPASPSQNFRPVPPPHPPPASAQQHLGSTRSSMAGSRPQSPGPSQMFNSRPQVAFCWLAPFLLLPSCYRMSLPSLVRLACARK